MMAVLLPLAFNPFATQPSEAVKAAVLQAITISMVIACIVSTLQKRTTQSGSPLSGGRSLAASSWLTDNVLVIPVLVYAGVYCVATITSIEPRQSFWGMSTRQGTLTVMYLVIFFILIAGALRSSAQVERLITTLIVVSVPVAMYGWLQYLGLDPLDWDTTSLSPVHSTVGYSLYLGAFLAMLIPFTLYRVFGDAAHGIKRSFPYLIILVLQVMCLLFTLSRGAWLGLLGGVTVFFWLMTYRWRRRRLFIFSVVVLIVGGFMLFSMNQGSVLPSFTMIIFLA